MTTDLVGYVKSYMCWV